MVHGPIYGRFMGFYVNGFLSLYRFIREKTELALPVASLIACEQALLFGREKRVSRERESERPLRRAFSRGAPKEEGLLAGYFTYGLSTEPAKQSLF